MGKPLTEEHKKAISEALTKDGGKQDGTKERKIAATDQGNVQRSAEAQALFTDFSSSRNVTLGLRAQREQLKKQSKGLGRKKLNKAQRAKIKEQLKKISEALKTEQKKRQIIVEQAYNAQRMKKAQEVLKKVDIRKKQIDDAEKKVHDLMITIKDNPERRERMQKRLDRIAMLRTKQDEVVKKSNTVISKQGRVAKKTDTAFNFNEQICLLSEKKYQPFRELNRFEKRTDFRYLNNEYNDLETELQEELTKITDQEIQAYAAKAEKRLDAGDVAGMAALLLLIRGSVKQSISKAAAQAYEAGKKTASDEMEVQRPSTPQKQQQLNTFEVNDISSTFVAELEKEGRTTIRNGLLAGASIKAIISVLTNKLRDKSQKMIKGISGSIVGQNINRGREQVFRENISLIKSFQRSEILDTRTCYMCMALDGKVVDPDDPMARLDMMHTNCRGVWIPIFGSDTDQPKVTGIPAAITKRFDTIDGRPIINAFKQFKEPPKL